MLSYELLKKFESMNEEQQRYAIHSFFGSLAMAFEGFRDSQSRPEFTFAKYALLKFGEAMLLTERNADIPIGDVRRVIPLQEDWARQLAEKFMKAV